MDSVATSSHLPETTAVDCPHRAKWTSRLSLTSVLLSTPAETPPASALETNVETKS